MAKPAFTPPKPVLFGRADNDRVWLEFETADGQHCSVTWPGDLREAETVTRLWNALKPCVEALIAIRSDVRDPDTDTAISGASGEKLDEALAAVGVRP
ncbi:hypothetical protein [Methylobacterium thuringiense]|uniref:DUF1902 domain-containing protein n=1 Tax=Methylobacterium thuringiense TaxID=1003091 RepID=A0ABQ4THR2_9HYPH|nr:hypothetical protein [Methylobacterium thuringiense]GJE54536.1 hypothetical protein EKPJFOCH_1014 [Methylobacterium thuringiense]